MKLRDIYNLISENETKFLKKLTKRVAESVERQPEKEIGELVVEEMKKIGMFKKDNITIREIDILEKYPEILSTHPSLYDIVEACVEAWMEMFD